LKLPKLELDKEITVLDHETPLGLEYRRLSWITGVKHARTLKFLERATIETTILPKGYVVPCSELWGENQVDLKPPLTTLAIMCLHEVIAKVTSKKGPMEKGLFLET
jgi:hypothetical protein